METTKKINHLKNLRNTQVSPSLRIPQGVQVLTVLFSFLGLSIFSQNAYAAYSASVSRTSSEAVTLSGGSGTIKPSSSGTLGVGSDVVSVSSNCTAGYNLYVSATNGGSTNLKREGASASELQNASNYIASTATATGSEATLSKDTWGVGKNGTTFSKIPAYTTDTSSLTPLYTGTGDASSTAQDFTVYYGANVSTAKTPGTYTGDILYTVVMNDACVKYALNFNGNGATANNLTTQSIVFDSTINLADISSADKIARTGYTLTGWKDQNNNEYGITGTADVNPTDASTVTLTAQWKINSRTVSITRGTNVSTVTATDGTTTKTNDTLTAEYNKTITVSATAFSTGYHFSGWTVNSGGVTLYSNSSMTTASTTSTPAYFRMPDQNVTLTANAAANTYTFSYNSNGATSGSPATSSNTGTYGGNVTTSNTGTMAKTGYHLLGWSTSSTATSATCSANASCSVTTLATNAGKTGAGDNGATITLYAVWAANTFSITYSANGGTGAASKTSETATYGTNVTMPTKNTLAKSGYDFLGWSTSSTATSATWAVSASVAPASIKSDVTTVNGGSVTVYAVWKISVPVDDGKKGNFQTTSICKNIGAGHTATLTDTRDNQTYKVYRWPNSGTAGTDYPTSMSGYCIMTQDLSLGYATGGSITKGSNLSLTTTTSAASGTITYRSSSSSWSTTDSDSNLQYTNGPKSGSGTYSSHSYYSYGAAQKVCPKGWRPPTNTEYSNIASFMGGNSSSGSSKIRGTPYNFVYGGYFFSSGWGGVGSSGNYWSSTQVSSTIGYFLTFNSSALNTSNGAKNLGRSVRCVAAS